MKQKLFTKEIEAKLQKQFWHGSDLETQDVICKIFNPYGPGTWYIVNQDPGDPDYLWAIVDWYELEVGSVAKSDLESARMLVGYGIKLPLERDKAFQPENAKVILKKLRDKIHV